MSRRLSACLVNALKGGGFCVSSVRPAERHAFAGTFLWTDRWLGFPAKPSANISWSRGFGWRSIGCTVACLTECRNWQFHESPWWPQGYRSANRSRPAGRQRQILIVRKSDYVPAKREPLRVRWLFCKRRIWKRSRTVFPGTQAPLQPAPALQRLESKGNHWENDR